MAATGFVMLINGIDQFYFEIPNGEDHESFTGLAFPLEEGDKVQVRYVGGDADVSDVTIQAHYVPETFEGQQRW